MLVEVMSAGSDPQTATRIPHPEAGEPVPLGRQPRPSPSRTPAVPASLLAPCSDTRDGGRLLKARGHCPGTGGRDESEGLEGREVGEGGRTALYFQLMMQKSHLKMSSRLESKRLPSLSRGPCPLSRPSPPGVLFRP